MTNNTETSRLHNRNRALINKVYEGSFEKALDRVIRQAVTKGKDRTKGAIIKNVTRAITPMRATQLLDPKEVYRDFLKDVISGKLKKLEMLYNHVAYIKDLTEILKTWDSSVMPLNELAGKALNRIEDVLKKLNKEPKRQKKQIPTNMNEATVKLYEATANMYPGIGDLGKITALIFTLRNTPLHYAKLIYPNIKNGFHILRDYLGLETYKLDANGIKPDESMINDEKGTPGIIGYPDYPRFLYLREIKNLSPYASRPYPYYPNLYYFDITTSETEAKQISSCSQLGATSFRIDLNNCGTQTLGGAISCMLIAIKYLWSRAPREELNIEPESAVGYLIEGTTNNPEIKAFRMPYCMFIYEYGYSSCYSSYRLSNECYDIMGNLRSYSNSYHSIPLHLIKIGPDVFLGNAEIAFIKFANNRYGYVVFTTQQLQPPPPPPLPPPPPPPQRSR